MPSSSTGSIDRKITRHEAVADRAQRASGPPCRQASGLATPVLTSARPKDGIPAFTTAFGRSQRRGSCFMRRVARLTAGAPVCSWLRGLFDSPRPFDARFWRFCRGCLVSPSCRRASPRDPGSSSSVPLSAAGSVAAGAHRRHLQILNGDHRMRIAHRVVQLVTSLRCAAIEASQSVDRLAPVLRSLPFGDTAAELLQVLLLPLPISALTVRRRRRTVTPSRSQRRHQSRRRSRPLGIDTNQRPRALVSVFRTDPLDRLRLAHPHPAEFRGFSRWLSVSSLQLTPSGTAARRPGPPRTSDSRLAPRRSAGSSPPVGASAARLHVSASHRVGSLRHAVSQRHIATHSRRTSRRRPQSPLLADGPVPHPAARPGEPAQGVRGAGCGRNWRRLEWA